MRLLKLTLLIIIYNCFLFSQQASDILKKVEKKYNNIKDATIEFTQINVFGVSKIENKFDGTLWMKKDNKYKIMLENQTIVTDGKTVWSYYSLNKQLIIDDYREDPNSFSPDKIMVSIPKNYNSILLGEEKLNSKNTFILKLTPKDEKSLIKSMKAWIDKDEYLIQKVEVIDISDNATTYLSKIIRINTGLKDELFKLSPPDDVEVLDLRKRK